MLNSPSLPSAVPEVPAAYFARYVAERAGDDDAPLHHDDLRLACACALRDRGALATFVARFGPAIRQSIARVAPHSVLDDAQQRVLTKLLVPTPNRPATITRYSGRSKLSTWLRVVARREAINLWRAERRRVGVHHAAQHAHRMMNAVVGSIGEDLRPELRDVFKESFAAAMARLAPRERNLLRYESIEGLTIAQIAQIYSVSPGTVSRWRRRIRHRVFMLTQDAFLRSASSSEGAFKDMLEALRSHLDMSLSRVLGRTYEPTHNADSQLNSVLAGSRLDQATGYAT